MHKLDHIGLLVLVSGVSGAGKSVAIDTLSDLGFYTVENLPVSLFLSFLEFTRRSPGRFAHTALSLDIDSIEKQELLKRILDDCEKTPGQVRLLFLDCKTDVIVKRYGQTRRPHPGFNPEKDNTLEDTILREKRTLFPVREASSLVIDTSELNVHDLRREVRAFVEKDTGAAAKPLAVNFLSFGFKHGVPNDCDLVIDVRFLPNPYFITALRDKTGKEAEIIDFVTQSGEAAEFASQYCKLLEFLLPRYVASGKLYLNIGVGCTGGKHRSVVVSELLAERTQKLSFQAKGSAAPCHISVRHRDIDKPN